MLFAWVTQSEGCQGPSAAPSRYSEQQGQASGWTGRNQLEGDVGGIKPEQLLGAVGGDEGVQGVLPSN